MHVTEDFVFFAVDILYFKIEKSIKYYSKKKRKKLLSSSEFGISKAKDKFLTTMVNIIFISNKTRCTYFNSLISGGSKKSNILKQTSSIKLLFILGIYYLLLPSGMRVLKEETVKEKNFCEFVTLVLFKGTLFRNYFKQM